MIQSGYWTSLSMTGYSLISLRLFLQFNKASSSNFVVDDGAGAVVFDATCVADAAGVAGCVAVPLGIVFHFLKSLFTQLLGSSANVS